MAGILKSLLLLPLIANLVQSHMDMRYPIPFNSKYDSEYYGASVDYSMTSPLRPDGSNYPCKGYHTEGKDKIQAEFVPGGTYNLTLAGSANHNGGSCQLSLSYDNGSTFKVIRSFIGGCPLKLNWDFKIPESAPASDSVLFAWTWFNLVGNREMYMNCARVSISNQPIPRYKRAVVNRQASFNSLPDLFVCNVGNGCTTIERHEVVFPNPGSEVEYNQDSVTPEAGLGFVLSGPPPPGNAFSNTTSPSTGSNSTLPAPTGSLNYTTTGYANTSTMTTTTTMISTLTSLAATTTSSSFSFSPIGGVFVTVNTTTTTATTMPVNGTGVSTATFTTSSILPPFPMPNATITAGPTGTGTGTSGNIGNSTLTDSRSSNATMTTDSSTITTIIDVISTSTSGSITTTTITTDSASSTTASSSSSSASSSSSSSSNSSSSTSSVSGSSSSTPSTASTTITPNAMTTTPATSVTVTTTTTTTTSSASATFSTINVSGPCTPGAFACNSPTTFSQCVPNTAGTGAYVFMGAVAPGTECRNGAFVRAGSQPCSPVGALLCDGETAFRLCDIGGTVNMGPVAPGTRCANGVIVAA